ncbi:dihydrodipicolinate synthetase [Bifidobacterium actinocoloniiforme DSM 22766]|uniref:Dihydrodipicolinate synthetase n=1 Tax=Bifidobacterium actinocoloniiforme DSM 22766 TaxID=1437605 RepID=A0A086YZF6_9BIFI|nr:dihydrodipicolinate synthase family protein [Bifidobacterium actinocoloniiforme]AKV54991.1 dihydrodipicolinate synthase [Bifidobacterium actinocoloniiforme DSM 22766]KFI39656.1 dihydrodipicolinate synthetase [Bifidobacterium actinocoloniiforme DSM 22766]
MMSKHDFAGIFVPILTPINGHGAIDEAKLRRQTDFVIEHGVDGILAFGSNSEFYMFEDQEMLDAATVILDQAAGRVPVMFGVGHIRTSRAVALAQAAAGLDVAAVSVLQPMFIEPTKQALYHHYAAIAQAIAPTPMFIYNNPGRAGYALSIGLMVRLAHDFGNIIGVKDSSGNITNIEELVRRDADIEFSVFAGKDTIVFPSLCVGAAGAVCSTANIFPDLVCGIYDNYVAGDQRAALAAQFKLNPLRISQDAASFPSPTKDMANLMGMDVGPSILPTEAAEGKALEGMKAAMRETGYLD